MIYPMGNGSICCRYVRKTNFHRFQRVWGLRGSEELQATEKKQIAGLFRFDRYVRPMQRRYCPVSGSGSVRSAFPVQYNGLTSLYRGSIYFSNIKSPPTAFVTG